MVGKRSARRDPAFFDAPGAVPRDTKPADEGLLSQPNPAHFGQAPSGVLLLSDWGASPGSASPHGTQV
ncbi:MAG: hypothetical protein ACK53V_11375, partial [Planctomycetota bacterium]